MNVSLSGNVLIVVWSKEGTSEHPEYVYWNESIKTWYPEGYSYSGSVEGLEGNNVECSVTNKDLPPSEHEDNTLAESI